LPTRERVFVSGVAKITKDLGKIRELYRPAWMAWFEDEGDGGDGTATEPLIVLIGVDARSARYMAANKPQPLMLLESLRGSARASGPPSAT